jgi:hypothetical protein
MLARPCRSRRGELVRFHRSTGTVALALHRVCDKQLGIFCPRRCQANHVKRLTHRQRLRFTRAGQKRGRSIRRKQRAIAAGERSVVLPEVIDLISLDNHRQLLLCIETLRRLYCAPGVRRIALDFRHTTRMTVSGTLLLHAELHRLHRWFQDRVRLRIIRPLSNRASQVLQQVEIYSLAGMKHKDDLSREDVVHWKVAHGSSVDLERAEPVLEDFQGSMAESLNSGIWRGLGEAITNSIHHAYGSARGDGIEPVDHVTDWWMFSQERDGKLTVAVCDLGVGIPATLPPTMRERVKAMAALSVTPTDSDLVYAAIEESRTRTALPERGLGLGQIVNTVKLEPGGVVVIFSNRGRVTIADNKTTRRNYELSILGTLIMWQVPLKPRRAL